MKRQAVVVAIAMLVQAPLATAPAEAIPFATSATGLGQSEPLIQQVAVDAPAARGRAVSTAAACGRAVSTAAGCARAVFTAAGCGWAGFTAAP